MHMPEALTLNTDAQACAGKQQRIFDLDQSTGLSSIHPSIHPSENPGIQRPCKAQGFKKSRTEDYSASQEAPNADYLKV